MGDIYGKFYSPQNALDYGRPYVFSVGARSIGKSTGWAIHLIRDFIRKKHQWIYCRRTKDETDLTAEHFFDTAISIYNRFYKEANVLEYKGGEYFINGELAGYAIPLSLQQKYKSGNYSGVWWILYDEFMIAPGSGARYIGGKNGMSAEVDAMSSLYQSVDRGEGQAFRNETTVAFLGNAGTFYNPFFMSYGVDRYLRPDTKYLAPKGMLWVVECTAETEATKEIKESYGYQLSTAKTKDYAYGNKYADLMRSEAFIEKHVTGDRTPMFTMVYEKAEYAVYAYMDKGFLWIGHGHCDGRARIALTCEDHRPNYLLISQWRGHYLTNLLKQMYDRGCVRFADNKCKMVLDFYLKYDII